MSVQEETLRLVFEALGVDAATSGVEGLSRSLTALGAARANASTALQDVAKLTGQLSTSLKSLPQAQQLKLNLDPQFATHIREATTLIDKLQGSKRVDIKATTNVGDALRAATGDLQRLGLLKNVAGQVEVKAGPELRALARGGGEIAELRNQLRVLGAQSASSVTGGLAGGVQRAFNAIRSQFAGFGAGLAQLTQSAGGVQAFRQLNRGITETKESLTGASSALAGVASGQSLGGITRIGLGFGGLAIAATVAIDVLRRVGGEFLKPITEAAAWEQGVIRLGFALRGVGKFSEETVQGLQRQAEALRTTRGVSDEAVTGVQTLLVQLGGLSGDTLKQATARTLDLAAALGIDLQSAAFLVAKAAAGSTEALSRYGLKLDDTIPKNEKFAALMALIAQKFPGAAEAMTKGFAGALERMKISFGDLEKEFGKPFLASFAQTFNQAAIAMDKVTASVARLHEAQVGTISDNLKNVGAQFVETAALGKKAAAEHALTIAKFSEDITPRITLAVQSGDARDALKLIAEIGQAAENAAAQGDTAFADFFKGLKRQAEAIVKVNVQADRTSLATTISAIENSINDSPTGSATVKVKLDDHKLTEMRAKIATTLAGIPDASVEVRADSKIDADITKALGQSAVLKAGINIPVTVPPATATVTAPTDSNLKGVTAALSSWAHGTPVEIASMLDLKQARVQVDQFKSFVAEALLAALHPITIPRKLMDLNAFLHLQKPPAAEVADIVKTVVATAPAAVLPMHLDLAGKDISQLDTLIKEQMAKLDALDLTKVPDAQNAKAPLEAIRQLRAARNLLIDVKVNTEGAQAIDQIRSSLESVRESGKHIKIEPVSVESLLNSLALADALPRLKSDLSALAADADIPASRIAQSFNAALRSLSAFAAAHPEVRKTIEDFQKQLLATVGPVITPKLDLEQARTQADAFRQLLGTISGASIPIQLQGLSNVVGGIDAAKADLLLFPAAAKAAFATGDLTQYQAVLGAIAAADKLLITDANAFSTDEVAALNKVRAAALRVLPSYEDLAKAQDKFKDIRLNVQLGNFAAAQTQLKAALAELAKNPQSLAVQVQAQELSAAVNPSPQEVRQVQLKVALVHLAEARQELDKFGRTTSAKQLPITIRADFKKAQGDVRKASAETLAIIQTELVDNAKTQMASIVAGGLADILASPFIQLVETGTVSFKAIADAGKQMVAALLQELAKLAVFDFLKALFPGSGLTGFVGRAFGFSKAELPAPAPTSKAGPLPSPVPAPPLPAKVTAAVSVEVQTIRLPPPAIEARTQSVRLGIRIPALADVAVPAPRVTVAPDTTVRRVALHSPSLSVAPLADVRLAPPSVRFAPVAPQRLPAPVVQQQAPPAIVIPAADVRAVKALPVRLQPPQITVATPPEQRIPAPAVRLGAPLPIRTTPQFRLGPVAPIRLPAPQVTTPAAITLPPPEVRATKPAPVRLDPPRTTVERLAGVRLAAPAVRVDPSRAIRTAPRFTVDPIAAIRIPAPAVTVQKPPVPRAVTRIEQPAAIRVPAPEVEQPAAIRLPAPKLEQTAVPSIRLGVRIGALAAVTLPAPVANVGAPTIRLAPAADVRVTPKFRAQPAPVVRLPAPVVQVPRAQRANVVPIRPTTIQLPQPDVQEPDPITLAAPKILAPETPNIRLGVRIGSLAPVSLQAPALKLAGRLRAPDLRLGPLAPIRLSPNFAVRGAAPVNPVAVPRAARAAGPLPVDLSQSRATRDLAAAARQIARDRTSPRPLLARPLTPELAATAAFARQQSAIFAQSVATRGPGRQFGQASSTLSSFLPRPAAANGNTINIRAMDTRGVKQSLVYGELGRAMAQRQRRSG